MFIYVKAYTLFLLIRSIVNVYAITEQSEGPSTSEIPIGVHTDRK